MSDTRDPSEARRGWRLWAYFAGLVTLFIVAAVAGGLLVRHQAHDDARRAAGQDAAFAARKAVAPIADGIGILQPALKGAVADPSISEALTDPDACGVTFIKIGAFPAGHFDILRSDGSLVCSSRGASAPPHPGYAGADWLARVNAGPTLEAPVMDAVTGRPGLLIAESFPGGVALAFLELDPLGPELATQFGGRRNLEFLVTTADESTVLARSIDPARWVGRPLAETPFGRGAGTRETDIAGKPRIYGSATVEGLGWKVFAGADRAAALASADRLSNRGLAIIGCALLLLLVAAFVVERRIAHPIRKLSGTVRDARDGRAPTPAAFSTAGPTEVKALADDFQGLMAAVEHELGERRRAEEAARTSERTYRLLFEDYPQPMWIHDAETREFLEVNDAAVAHYGYTREEFLTMSLADIRAPNGPPNVSEGRGAERHVTKDGSVILVETSSHTVSFRDRQASFVIALDVTHRERVQRQLYQKQRLESLGELAGGVAHDFNNLLAVIINYAAFVRKEVSRADGDPNAVRLDLVDGDLEQIEHAGERGARLTQQLLAFARSEAIRTEALEINEVVEGVEQLLRRTIGEHVELVYVLGSDVWPMVADRGQLEQVLVNLAVNARDAMPGGGTVTVETGNIEVDAEYAATQQGLAPGAYVRLRVSDTGEGMDEHVQQYAFEPFFTTKAKGEGTGLGLATVHGIVTQAGGHASIYSEPGVGTTFSALFPAVREKRPDQAQVTTPTWRLGHGETVLVVDDEPAIREVARRILVHNGYEVVTAPDGPTAVAIATRTENPIQLLLTDVVMPQMSGPELAERIAAVRPGLPVLFMSGYAQPVLGSRGAIHADASLVEKPFSELMLLDRVGEVLDRRS